MNVGAADALTFKKKREKIKNEMATSSLFRHIFCTGGCGRNECTYLANELISFGIESSKQFNKHIEHSI